MNYIMQQLLLVLIIVKLGRIPKVVYRQHYLYMCVLLLYTI